MDQRFSLIGYPYHYINLPITIYYGDRSIVEIFLKGSANMNIFDEYLDYVLYIAACRNNTGIVDILLEYEYNININIKNSIGQTPFLIAARNNY
jgi:ankyrin repeat protein